MTTIKRPAGVPKTATIEAYCKRCKATRIPADKHDTHCGECGKKLKIKGWWWS